MGVMGSWALLWSLREAVGRVLKAGSVVSSAEAFRSLRRVPLGCPGVADCRLGSAVERGIPPAVRRLRPSVSLVVVEAQCFSTHPYPIHSLSPSRVSLCHRCRL